MSQWDYTESAGPATWHYGYPLAGGKQQSPIDIRPNTNVHLDGRLERSPLSIEYAARSGKQLVNTGTGVKVDVAGGKCELKGGPLKYTYKLEQFHWHWGSNDRAGSEHAMNGQFYPAELHLVHWNSDLYQSFGEAVSQEDGLAVLGVFLKVGSSHRSLHKITDLLSKVEFNGEKCDISSGFDITTLLPADTTRYFTYNGSLTTPPCYETVKWIVFNDPVQVSSDQLTGFRKLKCCSAAHIKAPEKDVQDLNSNEIAHIVDNFRPPQPIGDRIVLASFKDSYD